MNHFDDTDAPVEALPCPFCGDNDPDFEYSGEAQEDCWIQCQACLCQGPVATIGCRDEDEYGEIDLVAEATELWNKRATPLRLVKSDPLTAGETGAKT